MRNIHLGSAVRLSLIPFAFGASLAANAPVVSAGQLTLTFDSTCPNPSFVGNVISCGSGGTTSAPSCSPIASNPTPTPGATVTLTANCSGSPTSYSWTGAATGSGSTLVVNPTTQSTYTVTATNDNGTSQPRSVTVSPGASQPPPVGGGNIPATCGTLKVINVGAVPMNGDRVTSNGFGANVIAIASFTVPAGFPGTQSTISVFEYAGDKTSRKAWFSQTPCDMSGTGPYFSQSTGPVFYFTIGGTASGMKFSPGQTWYMMVKNEKPFSSTTSCPIGSCDIGIKWYPPN